MLCIFVDGAIRVKPLVLFQRKEVLTQQYDIIRIEAEMAHYDLRVLVKFNENAYRSEYILIDWITYILVPALPPGSQLLALDIIRFHKTDTVLNTLESHIILRSLIMPGCTSLLHPLDIAINKPAKYILRQLTEDAWEDFEYHTGYNDPTIGSYNDYHPSPNSIPSCNQMSQIVTKQGRFHMTNSN